MERFQAQGSLCCSCMWLVGAAGLGPGSLVLLPQLLARDLRGEMTLPVVDECQPLPHSSVLGLEVTRLLSLTQVLSSVGGGLGPAGGLWLDVPGPLPFRARAENHWVQLVLALGPPGSGPGPT